MEQRPLVVLDDSDLSIRQDKVKVDILHLFKVLVYRIPEMLIVACALAIAAILGLNAITTPYYTSSTKINILQMNTQASYNLSAQLLSPMTVNCINTIRSRYVAEKTIEYFDLDMSYAEFERILGVMNEPNSSIVTISVTAERPNLARMMTAFVRAETIREIRNTVGMMGVGVIEEASYPEKASNNPTSKGLLAGLAGGFLCALLIIVMTIRSDTLEWKAKAKRMSRQMKSAHPASTENDGPKKKEKAKEITKEKAKDQVEKTQ